MFEETLEISPPFKSPLYYVYRATFDMHNNYWNVAYFPEGEETCGVVIGRFPISRKMLNDCVREIILDSAEQIILSRDVILKEIPVYTTWDGAMVSSVGMIFGRRV